jgi:hypothetical protein
MVAITQLHSSNISSAELNRILNQYLALSTYGYFAGCSSNGLGLLSLAVLVIGLAFH